MPYERGFWGNAGLSLGRAKLHAPCPGGTNCDLRDGTWRAHVGGRFNNMFGAEIGWVDLGNFGRGGGQTSAHGLDLKALAGVPIGQNSSVFGKLGVARLRSNVSGSGLSTGEETGWGPTYGLGAQVGLTKNWAVRGDIDRYRVKLPGGKDNVDTYMLGAQYSFQ
jgi:opacity protein-like surface antigen